MVTGLAAYAVSERSSRGRHYPESPPAHRTEFQRDRDRIVHCTAFRRLEYKTQVFVNHEGDMFRTRLTHSLEVAQISRTVARALGLNEDLAEAIALAHDLGHTPFGHAGQEALDECMRANGGFEHNIQSLRVVDRLEERYAAFPGLNLTFETREGILKHVGRAKARMLGEVGRRFLDRTHASLEAQVTNIADEIAYNNHDIDDGLRSGLIDLGQLETLSIPAEQLAQVRREYPRLDTKRLTAEAIRRAVNAEVSDLVDESQRRIGARAPADVAAVRAAGVALIGFTETMRVRHDELKRFLRDNLYRHPRVRSMTERAALIVRALFAAYLADPAALPERVAVAGATAVQPPTLARQVADYVAGMTDRFAIAEYRRLIGPIDMN
ncbi:MAG: deoxyguanosinetriphosphate triphosphohydrolase [Gammaproteobacteria bacterium]|nr:deoxyguanosinetriphosphate triphosphohydrolase [Gammaproteobacteria bacterium]